MAGASNHCSVSCLVSQLMSMLSRVNFLCAILVWDRLLTLEYEMLSSTAALSRRHTIHENSHSAVLGKTSMSSPSIGSFNIHCAASFVRWNRNFDGVGFNRSFGRSRIVASANQRGFVCFPSLRSKFLVSRFLVDLLHRADIIKLSWREVNPSKGSFWTARFYFWTETCQPDGSLRVILFYSEKNTCTIWCTWCSSSSTTRFLDGA